MFVLSGLSDIGFDPSRGQQGIYLLYINEYLVTSNRQSLYNLNVHHRIYIVILYMLISILNDVPCNVFYTNDQRYTFSYNIESYRQ